MVILALSVLQTVDCTQLLVEQSEWLCLFLLPSQGMQGKDAGGVLSQLPHVERGVLFLLLHGEVSESDT